MEKYRSNGQQRVLKIMLILAGHEINGLAPGEVARAADTSPSNAIRALENLRIAGIAERIPESERWRLSPRVPQIATAMLNGISRSQSKVDEVKQRYTTNPY